MSSVLYAVCQDVQQKRILLSWIEEMPEMDIVDFEFPADQIGRILLTTVESNGQRISAYSLSDGTLRFLAVLAAFLGPERARLYFFEELENYESGWFEDVVSLLDDETAVAVEVVT